MIDFSRVKPLALIDSAYWQIPSRRCRFSGSRAQPYRQQEELLLDILRYGADVEVISPPELRQVIYQRLRNALRQYQVVPEQ